MNKSKQARIVFVTSFIELNILIYDFPILLHSFYVYIGPYVYEDPGCQ